MPSRQKFSLPNALPVMLLSGCTLFPHALLPLFIFEPRYRKMLARALETDRMFCIGTLQDGEEWEKENESDERIYSHSAVGLVRACVRGKDGTSHLMLQGLARVRFDGWEQREPFRVARIEPLPTIVGNKEENRVLCQHLLKRVTDLLEKSSQGGKELGAQLKTVDDPEVLADFVGANFLTDSSSRQALLEMTEIGSRLKFLIEALEEI